MALVAARCSQCGGDIKVDKTQKSGVCKHCGTEFITQEVINNYTTVHNITNNVTKIINGKEIDDGETYFNRGLTNLTINNFVEARKCFSNAIKMSPEIGKYYFYWCYAASNGLKDYYTFLGIHGKKTYFYDNGEEEVFNLETFFKIASKNDKKELSKQYGLDFTKTYEQFMTDVIADMFLKDLIIKSTKRSKCVEYYNLMKGLSKSIQIKLVPYAEEWAIRNNIVENVFLYNVKEEIHPLAVIIKKSDLEFTKNDFATFIDTTHEVIGIQEYIEELESDKEKYFDILLEIHNQNKLNLKKINKVTVLAIFPIITIISLLCVVIFVGLILAKSQFIFSSSLIIFFKICATTFGVISAVSMVVTIINKYYSMKLKK